MHSIRTYLLQALTDPAERDSAQFGDAALDGRLSVAGPLSARHPPRPKVHSARLRPRMPAGPVRIPTRRSGRLETAATIARRTERRPGFELRAHICPGHWPSSGHDPLVSILLFTILHDFCDPDPSGANARHHLTESARMEAATESGQ